MVNSWLRILGALALGSLMACSSGPEEAEDAGRAREAAEHPAGAASAEPFAAPRSAPVRDPYDMTASELEAELSLTRAGQVLVRAMRAHGGWDAWRHVVRLEYERSRTRSAGRGEAEESPESGDEPAMEASPAAGRPALETGDAGEEPPRPEVARVVLARSDARGPWRLARLSAGADPADASALGARVEAIASTAPFAFVDRGLHAADLGVELDAASGYSLRKVQFAERSAEGPFLCIAYFDAQAYVLRRLLFPRPGGEGFLMVIVTDCDPIGETGVLLALRRQAFVLEKRFSRIPRRAPLYEETLSLISTEVKTAAGE